MKNKSLLYIGGAIVLLVVLFFFVRPNTKVVAPDNNSNSSGQTVVPPPASQAKSLMITVKDGKVALDPAAISIIEGDQVKLVITADVDEEFHLHGYDKAVDLKKDVPQELTFTANLTGRFPYELEKSKRDLGVLEVLPK